jgi:hypothetical protein
MSDPRILTRLEAMAILIKEHEIMRLRLKELGEITDTLPIKWIESGKTLVDLDEFFSQIEKETNARNRNSDYPGYSKN